jgi:hypothetical protein
MPSGHGKIESQRRVPRPLGVSVLTSSTHILYPFSYTETQINRMARNCLALSKREGFSRLEGSYYGILKDNSLFLNGHKGKTFAHACISERFLRIQESFSRSPEHVSVRLHLHFTNHIGPSLSTEHFRPGSKIKKKKENVAKQNTL